jgi:predicted metalloendopeptidase
MRQRHLFATLLIGAGLALSPSLSGQAPGRSLGVDTTGFDRDVRPQDDFDRFVNGRWSERTEIPADRSGWGSFTELDEHTQIALKAVVEDAAAARSPSGSLRQKVGAFYASYMDSATIEHRGLKPLAAELAAIGRVSSHAGLPAAMARLQKIGVTGLFSGRVQQDPKQSSVYVVSVGQVDVPLGDRNFYLLDSDAFKKIRAAYVDYLTTLFTLSSTPDPAGAAQRVLAFETEVAGAQWDRVRNRDREATYNPMPVEGLAKMMPSFSWYEYLGAAGMGGVRDVIVRQPDYLQAMDRIVVSTPVSTWREYMTARLLDDYANELPAAFAEARFELRGRVLSGQQQRPVRWKRGITEVEANVGEALGRLYIEKNFPPDAKARIDALVKNLLAAFRAGIDDSTGWALPRAHRHAPSSPSSP